MRASVRALKSLLAHTCDTRFQAKNARIAELDALLRAMAVHFFGDKVEDSCCEEREPEQQGQIGDNDKVASVLGGAYRPKCPQQPVSAGQSMLHSQCWTASARCTYMCIYMSIEMCVEVCIDRGVDCM